GLAQFQHGRGDVMVGAEIRTGREKQTGVDGALGFFARVVLGAGEGAGGVGAVLRAVLEALVPALRIAQSAEKSDGKSIVHIAESIARGHAEGRVRADVLAPQAETFFRQATTE